MSDYKASVVESKAKVAENEHFPMYRVCQKFIKIKVPYVLLRENISSKESRCA